MHEALLYEKIGDGRVRCNLCAHRCVLSPGVRGLCNVRVNRDGVLYTTVYGRVVKRGLQHVITDSRIEFH